MISIHWFTVFNFSVVLKVSLLLNCIQQKFYFLSPWNPCLLCSDLTPPRLSFHSHHLCLLFLIKMHNLTSATHSSLPLPNLLFPLLLHLLTVSLPSLLLLPLNIFSCSVLRGWGQWRMARVAMTTPEASTARMASMVAASSCVSSSSYPSKMTPVPAMCSCFVGENNQL